MDQEIVTWIKTNAITPLIWIGLALVVAMLIIAGIKIIYRGYQDQLARFVSTTATAVGDERRGEHSDVAVVADSGGGQRAVDGPRQ